MCNVCVCVRIELIKITRRLGQTFSKVIHMTSDSKYARALTFENLCLFKPVASSSKLILALTFLRIFETSLMLTSDESSAWVCACGCVRLRAGASASVCGGVCAGWACLRVRVRVHVSLTLSISLGRAHVP